MIQCPSYDDLEPPYVAPATSQAIVPRLVPIVELSDSEEEEEEQVGEATVIVISDDKEEEEGIAQRPLLLEG